jgi:lysylphosphatidylglycerol synthetase-like protein (DUF2156 family)
VRHWTRPAPLAGPSFRRWRKRQRAEAPRQPAPRAPAGVLAAARHAALWAITVVITAASGASFAESYRGLWLWARHHGLSGFWAAAFPLQVDAFIVVGELVLLVAMIDRWSWRERAGAWLVALLGLAVSVAGNIGHVAARDVQSRGTAAIPPVAAFAALWLGLAVLKRVLARHAAQDAAPAELHSVLLPQVPGDAETAALIALRATTWAGKPLSGRQLETRFGLSRAQATRVRQLAAAEAGGHPGADPDGEDATAA